MKILRIVGKSILAFILSLILLAGLFFSTAFAFMSNEAFESISDSGMIEMVFAILILALPAYLVLATFITEIRILLVKVKDEVDKQEYKKYGLDKELVKKECLESFNNLQNDIYTDDIRGLKKLFSHKGFENYMSIYDKYNDKNLAYKYEMLDFNLVNIEDRNGVLFFNYEIKVLQSINFLKKIVLNKRKMICYKMVFSYIPIINEKNCKNCGTVLSNTYKCPSCNSLLSYSEHYLRIEDIEIFKEIDRWC